MYICSFVTKAKGNKQRERSETNEVKSESQVAKDAGPPAASSLLSRSSPPAPPTHLSLSLLPYPQSSMVAAAAAAAVVQETDTGSRDTRVRRFGSRAVVASTVAPFFLLFSFFLFLSSHLAFLELKTQTDCCADSFPVVFLLFKVNKGILVCSFLKISRQQQVNEEASARVCEE